MIKKTLRRIISCLIMASLLLPSVSAATTPLPVLLLSDEISDPIRIIIYEPEVKKLSQFDEMRTEQLNRLIRHLSVDISMDQSCSNTSVMIDRQEVFSYLQSDTDDIIKRIYSFAPSLTYRDKQQETSTDTDEINTFLEQILYRASSYMDEFYSFFASVPDAFNDRAKREKTELRFTGFGRALQRVTVNFPADFVQERFPEALESVAESDDCRKVIGGLIFSGSQKIGLLYNEEGKIIRITYDGKVGYTPETLRKVALVWKVLREKGHQKDSVSFKSPAVTGADKDNISLERDYNSADSENEYYTWDIQADHRSGKDDKKQTRFTVEISNNGSALSGNMEYTVRRDGKITRLSVNPELLRENETEYKGTLEIADYSGKIEKNRYLIHVQLKKGEPVIWPAASVDHTEISGGTRETALPEEAATAIIQKLFELPEEDLKYFSNGIPEALWLELIH